ncbi:hypothetical protein GCM10025859_49130 [Alicyclobacillus fastidiosus]|nr:hypothetical protein GCM10025859_49130 [Alicyclobacillus fastidiosus]
MKSQNSCPNRVMEVGREVFVGEDVGSGGIEYERRQHHVDDPDDGENGHTT